MLQTSNRFPQFRPTAANLPVANSGASYLSSSSYTVILFSCGCASCGTPRLYACRCQIKYISLLFQWQTLQFPCVLFLFCYLASPGLSSTTPNKALVYDSEVLFPIVHLITVHMGAPGRTHDRQNIQD